MHKIPKVMRADTIDRFGGPEVLSIDSLPVPELEAREVLIAMHTAAYTLDRAARAHERLAEGHIRGRFVLRVRE
jgi:NADPH:quinone reductase-like Zn-dependent oxidoreductase